MARIDSDFKLTIPQAIAEQFGLKPGDEIDFQAAGSLIQLIPREAPRELTLEEKLRMFDESRARQEAREEGKTFETPEDRGWRREDLYDRGYPR